VSALVAERASLSAPPQVLGAVMIELGAIVGASGANALLD
jgi:hypothetical protein